MESMDNQQSGYQHCACRDCFELIVGKPGDFCDGCEEAGCPDYQEVEGMSQECQRLDAYGVGEEDDDYEVQKGDCPPG